MSNKRGLLTALALCSALLAAFFCAGTALANEPPGDGPVTIRKWVTDRDGPTEAEVDALRDPPPQADFTSSATGGVAPHTMAFTPTMSAGPATSYGWDFGESSTSTEMSPTHTYAAAGLYTVTLTVSGPGGADGETKVAYVHVAPSPVTDLAFGSWDGGSWTGAARDRGNLYYVMTPTTLSDIRVYLNVTTTTELRFFVYEGASPSGSFSQIHESHLAASGIGQSWYGSGLVDVRLQAARYYYIGCAWNGTATYGRGTESVPFDTAFGQLVSGVADGPAGYPPPSSIAGPGQPGQPPYWLALGVEVEPPPEADFAATPTTGEDPLAVEFTNTSTGTVTSVLWDFGDGTSSTVNGPAHVYTTTGVYSVTLTVAGPGGADTETKSEHVVVFRPGPGVIETFGDVSGLLSCFTGDAGNVFEVTTTTKLSRIAIYLRSSADKDMYYFVYEGASVPSAFTKVFLKSVPGAGSGDRWYSSGWIDATLKAGRYYYVGASWINGSACSPRGTESGPMATTFGTFRTGAISRVAGWPDFVPGDTSSTISGGFGDPRTLTIYTGDWSNHSEIYLPAILKNH